MTALPHVPRAFSQHFSFGCQKKIIYNMTTVGYHLFYDGVGGKTRPTNKGTNGSVYSSLLDRGA